MTKVRKHDAIKIVSLWPTMAKHEIISCERCSSPIECKANSYTKCQCSTVQLNLNEMQYISEQYDGCLCSFCLFQLQEAYKSMVISE
ncbi:MAG: cysteine-rich CWC family protein [Bacteroidota bacterium]